MENSIVKKQKTPLVNTMGEVGDGYVNIDMNDRFLYKSNCITHAKILIMNKYITGMTEQEIAEEIFAHAVCYYWYDPDGDVFHNNPIAKELHDHGADGIYIENNGDTKVRKAFYSLIWNTISGK